MNSRFQIKLTILFSSILLFFGLFNSDVSAQCAFGSPGDVCDSTQYCGPNYCSNNAVVNDCWNYKWTDDCSCTEKNSLGQDPHPCEWLDGCCVQPTEPPPPPPTPTPPPCQATTCDAPAPRCGQTTSGKDNCGNPCSKDGGACGCIPNGSCDAPQPACGTTTSGTNNCGTTCYKTGPSCPVVTATPKATPTITPSPTPVQPTEIITQSPVNKQPVKTSTGQVLPERWVCLKSEPCAQTDGSPSPNCSGKGTPGHRVKLTNKKDAPVLPNSQTWIFECLKVGNSNVCTSGNSNTDTTYLGQANLTSLRSSLGYVFDGLFFSNGNPLSNPVPVRIGNQYLNTNGQIGPFEWESHTKSSLGDISRHFLAMNLYGEGIPIGVDNTIKYGTFVWQGTDKKCVMIRWDPYGIVFDSQTLKPVEGAEVTLIKKTADGKFIPMQGEDVLGNFTNPIITKKDGLYDFKVPDGVYKINVAKSGYNLYSGGEIKIEKKQEEHNIALVPEKRNPDLIKIIFDIFSLFK